MEAQALVFLLVVAAAATSTVSYYQVASAYWSGVRTRELQLSGDIRSQDSNTQQLQCLMQLPRRKLQLGRDDCAVFYRGSASPCFIGTLRAHYCQNLRPPPEATADEDIKVWVTSVIRDSNCTMIQHRVSDSISFYRNWTEYVRGFGEGPSENFWIGLENIYALTRAKTRPLYVEMTMWNGSAFWASYPSFQIGPESDNYRLLSLGAFSPSSTKMGNSMSGCLNQNFSTFDSDNDLSPGSCSRTYKGAWWYNACHSTNPNGIYFNPPEALNTSAFAVGVVWSHPFTHYYSMMEFKMMLW